MINPLVERLFFERLLRMDVLKIQKNEKEDKVLFILFFSLVNLGLYLLITFGLTTLQKFLLDKHHWEVINNKMLLLGLSILVSVVVCYGLSLWLYPLVAKLINKSINSKRKNDGKAEINSPSPRSITFNRNMYQEVHIFKLTPQNGKRDFITSGYMDTWTETEGEQGQILLKPMLKGEKGNAVKISTEEEVFEIMNNEYIPDGMTNIYIDKELDMIFYIINYPVDK